MSDLVERLRGWADLASFPPAKLCNDSADEIARLEESESRAVNNHHIAAVDLKIARDEIARLTEEVEQSFEALGITKHAGWSLPEEITRLRKRAAELDRMRPVVDAARSVRDGLAEMDGEVPLGLAALWEILDERLRALAGEP